MKQKIVISLKSKDLQKVKIKIKSMVSDSEEELKKAIKELASFGEEFAKKRLELLSEEKSTEDQKLHARDTGELMNNITSEISKDGLSAKVFVKPTHDNHETFVEYGTGIRGEKSPHPEDPWNYDIFGHGEKGWTYKGKDGFRRTRGQPSRPFWLDTRLAAEEMVNRVKKKRGEVRG